jgi:hypothetical protein
MTADGLSQWYCCQFPKRIGPPDRRLESLIGNATETPSATFPAQLQGNVDMTENVLTVEIQGRQVKVDPENFRPKEDDKTYFQKIRSDFEVRKVATVDVQHSVDYADVFYWPYEWMVAVQTEVRSSVSFEKSRVSLPHLFCFFGRFSIISVTLEA